MFRIVREMSGRADLPEDSPRTQEDLLSWATDQTEVQKIFLEVAKRWALLSQELLTLTEQQVQDLEKDPVLKSMMRKTFLMRMGYYLKGACALANGSPSAEPGMWNDNRPWDAINGVIKRVLSSMF